MLLAAPAEARVYAEAPYSAVAVNARGDVLAVWERPLHGSTGTRGIYARERTAGATAFGAPEAVSDPGQFDEAAQAAFRQDGSVVAVWRSLSPGAVMWAVRAP